LRYPQKRVGPKGENKWEQISWDEALDTIAIKLNDLKEKFSDAPEFKLVATLYTYEKMGIVFQEDNYYLSLPLNYKKCVGITSEKKKLLSKDRTIEDNICM